jgi:hypothetical protein
VSTDPFLEYTTCIWHSSVAHNFKIARKEGTKVEHQDGAWEHYGDSDNKYAAGVLVHGKYFLYVLSEDGDKDTFHYGSQRVVGSSIPLSMTPISDATYSVGGSFSSPIAGWVDYFFVSETELWVSFNYRDKVQVKYSILSNGSWNT